MAGDGAVRFYRPDGEYGELSNFYPLDTPIRMYRWAFPTSEHLYQMEKYLDYSNDANMAYAIEISTASTPGKSQILGNRRRLSRYPWQIELNRIMDAHPDARIIDGFHEKKLDTMLWVLQSKFRADKHCREVLLSTGDRPLIEASPIDDFWGEGKNGRGENHLGRLLMVVRDELRQKPRI